jgi:2-iminobutanoate/2-iminopropanoate deaminase
LRHTVEYNIGLGILLLPALAFAQTRYINAPDLAPPNGYSHAVSVDNRGRTVYVSGAVGLDAKGNVVGVGDFKAQVTQAFANLRSALQAAGATPASVVKLNYYVVGLDHDKVLALRAARETFIDKDHPPASTLIGVQALFRDEVMVEIEATAVLP